MINTPKHISFFGSTSVLMYSIFISAAALPRNVARNGGNFVCSRRACVTRSRGPATKTCLFLCCFTRCLVVKNGNKKENLRVPFGHSGLQMTYTVTWIWETERYGNGNLKSVVIHCSGDFKVSAENGKQMV